MWVREMTRVLLCVAVVTQALICALAVWMGIKLIDWRALTPEELAGSPDARYVVETLMLRWGFLSGACVGLAIGLGLSLVAQRRAERGTIATTRISWFAVVVPPVVVLGFGVVLWK